MCAQQAQTLATYLNTGLPTSNDPTYGDERRGFCPLFGAQRALYIRQQADAYMSSATSSSKRPRLEIQSKLLRRPPATKAAAEQQAAEPACHAVGGSVSVSTDGSSVTCGDVTVHRDRRRDVLRRRRSNSTTTGQFTGPLETAGIGATQQECTSGDYPLGSNAAPGVSNSAVPGRFPPS